MNNIFTLLWTVLLSLSYLVVNSVAEDIIGCGGFVKSDIERVKTQIEVRL